MLLRLNIFFNPTFFFHKCMLYCLLAQEAEDAFKGLQSLYGRTGTGTMSGIRNLTAPGPVPRQGPEI